jgi:hypothetical protein
LTGEEFEAFKLAVTVRVIQVQMLLFNLNLSTTVYLSKLISLTASIVGGFGALKIMGTNVPFALFYGLLFVEGNLAFNIMFDKAHRIPEAVKEMKRVMLAGSSNLKRQGKAKADSNSDKKEVKKIVRSIQELGIQAGGFNKMERESTLIFGNYSVQQIVSLLLAF